MSRSRSLWVWVSDLLTGAPEPVELSSDSAVTLGQRGVRARLDGRTVEVQMGERRLLVSPRVPLATPAPDAVDELVVYRPEHLSRGIWHFASLHPGDVLVVDPDESAQRALFAQPADALRSSVQLRHEGDSLVVKSTPEPTVRVRAADTGAVDNVLATTHRAVLERLQARLPAASRGDDVDASLDRLRAVTRTLEHRSTIVRIAPDIVPILVGDLHGRADNLLTLLGHNGFWDGLENGTAAVVIVGDAVHPDEGENLAEMSGSVDTMDLILSLMQAFPYNVHFLVGNHDSFSSELMKDGLAQGALWESHLLNVRGPAYRDALLRFYDCCPLIATSRDWVACHAGPPRTSYTREMLANAKAHPSLRHELLWNRQKTPGQPGGYTGDDVERLRKVLELGTEATFVVGHYPRSTTGTFWMNAGGIAHHHVLVSSRHDRVAAIVRVGDEFVAQTYPAEPVAAWLRDAARRQAPQGKPPGPVPGDAARDLQS